MPRIQRRQVVVYVPGAGSDSQTIATQQPTESQVPRAWNGVHKTFSGVWGWWARNGVHKTFSGVWGWWARASGKGNADRGLDLQIEVISLLYFYPIPINSYTMVSTKQRLTPFFLQVVAVVQSQKCVWAHGLQHTRLPCPSLRWGLLKLMSIEFTMPSNHIIPKTCTLKTRKCSWKNWRRHKQMERHTMFIDWKNLQTQCNSYQITNSIFHWTETKKS